MTRMRRVIGPIVALVMAAGLTLGLSGGPSITSAADPAVTAFSAWDGSIDLYRDGVFTTQKSWLWCTAAGVQIVRNIVDDQEDHTVSGQRRYFNWMRERNRYTLPLSAGVDPQGWTAGLRHFVDDRYRLVSSTTFDNALRSAVKRLRLTSLPVALTVAHGNHGWIMTGFAATADPADTASFKVTSVQIVGPLYGLQSKNGYDMPPDTKLTPTQLKRFFTPWKYAPKAMIWDGRYVSIQPVPATTPSGAPAAPAVSAAPAASAAAATPATSVQSVAEPGGAQRAPGADQPLPEGRVSRPSSTPSGADPGAGAVAATLLLAAIVGIVAVRLMRTAGRGDLQRGPGVNARAPG